MLEWKAVAYPRGVTDFETWRPPATKEAMVQMLGGSVPPSVELVPEIYVESNGTKTEFWWPLQSIAAIVGNDLRSARRGADAMQRNVVDFVLSPEAGKRFQSATRENLRKKMAIVLGSSKGKVVISAPVINDVISDRGQISGRFDVKSAEDLALKLRSGAIPTAVTIIEERTVGPSLGKDSIRSGITAVHREEHFRQRCGRYFRTSEEDQSWAGTRSAPGCSPRSLASSAWPPSCWSTTGSRA